MNAHPGKRHALLPVQVLLVVVGTLVMAYGAFNTLKLPDVIGILWWGALGLVLHDAVWAPAVLFLERRSRSLGRWTRPLQVALVLAVPVLLATLPTIIGRPHVTAEPGLLPQSYLPGVVVVVVVALLAAAVTALRARRTRTRTLTEEDHG